MTSALEGGEGGSGKVDKSTDKLRDHVQGSTNRRAPGLVNFVLALAYHFCLNLPAAFTQPRARLLVEPCRYFKYRHKKNSLGMSNEHIFNKADKEAVDIGVVVVIAENGNSCCNGPKRIFIPDSDSSDSRSFPPLPHRSHEVLSKQS